MSAYLSLPNTSLLPAYFSENYETCRQRFLDAAVERNAKIQRLFLSCQLNLSIDLAYIGPLKAKKLMIHTSGTHGVEGFAGSAAQYYILTHMPALPEDTACLFVHGHNPWGMRHKRRTNENNVDLNRNYIFYKNDEIISNESAQKCKELIKPESKPTWWTRIKLTTSALSQEIFSGGLKKAIGDGQYLYPTGILYGGSELEEGPAELIAALEKYTDGIEELFFIDFHTGAPNARFDDSILPQCDDEGRLKKLYGNRLDDIGFADTNGTYDSAVRRMVAPHVKKHMFTQEVSTIYPHHPSLCLPAILLRTIEENQAYFFQGADWARESYFRAFHPKEDPKWEEKVLRVAWDAFYKGLESLQPERSYF